MEINLLTLSTGQRRIITTLLGPRVPTYRQVATKLHLSIGTVYRQLGRVRAKHPDLYQQVMTRRKTQLAVRHEQALERAEAHSKRYFRQRYNRQYKEKYGFYPWERRGMIGRRGSW